MKTDVIYHITSKNIFGPLTHDVLLPIEERVIRYLILRDGISNWYFGTHFYTEWTYSSVHGPYIKCFQVNLHEGDPLIMIRPMERGDWTENCDILNNVLDVLEKKIKVEDERESFSLVVISICRPFLLEELERLNELLSSIQKEPTAITLRYLVSSYGKPVEMKLIKINVELDGEKILFDFHSVVNPFLSIVTPHGEYTFTDSYGYANCKPVIETGYLVRCSSFFKEKGEMYGNVMTTYRRDEARNYLLKLIQFLEANK